MILVFENDNFKLTIKTLIKIVQKIFFQRFDIPSVSAWVIIKYNMNIFNILFQQ